MKRFLVLGALVLVVAACGGDGDSGVDLEGNAVFIGTFESGDGFGPGEVAVILDDEGTGITTISIDAGMDGFTCPAGDVEGSALSGGGYTLTIDPPHPISGGSFDVDGFAGTFSSATQVDGTYDLNEDFDCAFTITWSARTDSAVGS